MKKIFGSESLKTLKFADFFMNHFFNTLAPLEEKRTYSTKNQNDVSSIWNKFEKIVKKQYSLNELKSFNCATKEQLIAILADNYDIFSKKNPRVEIKTNLTEIQKEFKKYKASDNYAPLEDYDPNLSYEDDPDLGRAFVIYWAYEPGNIDCCKTYWINGKTTDPEVKHIQNLHRADWNYELGLGYYHGNTCLVDYYRKTDKEKLKGEYITDY